MMQIIDWQNGGVVYMDLQCWWEKDLDYSMSACLLD